MSELRKYKKRSFTDIISAFILMMPETYVGCGVYALSSRYGDEKRRLVEEKDGLVGKCCFEQNKSTTPASVSEQSD